MRRCGTERVLVSESIDHIDKAIPGSGVIPALDVVEGEGDRGRASRVLVPVRLGDHAVVLVSALDAAEPRLVELGQRRPHPGQGRPPSRSPRAG